LTEKKVVLFFLTFFLLVQLFGIYLGNGYLNLIKSGAVEQPEILPGVSPQSIENSVFLFLYIIVATVVIIFIVRYVRVLIRVVEAIVVFSATFLTFSILLPDLFLLDFFIALILNIWRVFRPNTLNQNLAIGLALPGIGALIGVSLGILPSLLFIVLLSVYDFVSVFITKHMIYMAKEVTKRPSAFALSMPYKFKKPIIFKVGKEKIKKRFHVFHLGSGDMVIPLMFAVSVLAAYGLVQALITVLGSAISFFLMLYFFTKKPQALPAIPIISSGTLAGFLISILFF